MSDQKPEISDFEKEAHSRKSNFFSELLLFLAQNKKWWLAPIFGLLLLLGVLLFLGGSAAAPFIYTLF